MNKIFPVVATLSSPVEATPGSIVRISRSTQSVFALVTDQKSNGASVDIVLLNWKRSGYPPVVFANGWRLSEPCLHYCSGTEFEINTELVDQNENKWWETPGVVVSIADQFYIRAARTDNSFGWPPLINLQSGQVFSGDLKSNFWTFGGWTLWVRDDKRSIKLCDFEVSI